MATALGDFTAGQILNAADLNAIGAYTSYTPTWTNLSVGAGTNTGHYVQIGEFVHWTAEAVLGSGFSVTGIVNIDFPVPAADYYQAATGGQVWLEDANGTDYYGALSRLNSTTSRVAVYNAASTYLTFTFMNTTVPFSWASGDRCVINGVYRAA